MTRFTATLTVETEQETDGRWIAEVLEVSGAMVYGATEAEAIEKVQALAHRELAERAVRRLQHLKMQSLTADQLKYIIENDGRLPPGVSAERLFSK